MRRRLIAAFTAAALFSSCSAQVYRQNLPSYRGRILESEPDALYLEGDTEPYRVPATEIRDVDHPGNVLMVVGGVLAGMGLTMAGVNALQPSGYSRPDDSPVVVGYVSVGALLGIAGLVPWWMSRSAAGRLEPVPPSR
jgi:hypothetical protein